MDIIELCEIGGKWNNWVLYLLSVRLMWLYGVYIHDVSHCVYGVLQCVYGVLQCVYGVQRWYVGLYSYLILFEFG